MICSIEGCEAPAHRYISSPDGAYWVCRIHDSPSEDMNRRAEKNWIEIGEKAARILGI